MLEATVAIGAGVVAGSIALVGFGADSVIEVAAGVVVLWLVTGGRLSSRPRRAARAATDRRLVRAARRLRSDRVRSAISLADITRQSAGWPSVSRGITLVAMLATCSGEAPRGKPLWLGSSAAVSESRQTMLCAYLSAALLAGLLANAVAGWWWADPIVALLIGAVALPAKPAAHGTGTAAPAANQLAVR